MRDDLPEPAEDPANAIQEVRITSVPRDAFVVNTEQSDAPQIEFREPIPEPEVAPTPVVQEILPPEREEGNRVQSEPEFENHFQRETEEPERFTMRVPPRQRPPRRPSWG